MIEALSDNRLTAMLLKEDIQLSYVKWRTKVSGPIQPFYDRIDRLIAPRTKGLTKANPAVRDRNDSRMRDSLTKQRWNFSHPHLLYKPDGVAAFVQLGSAELGEPDSVLWGLNWWGSSKNAGPIRKLFQEVRGSFAYKDRPNKLGATGTALAVIAGSYSAEEVLALSTDINLRITEDIVTLVDRLNKALSRKG
jgi:hypothetical protein